MTYHKKAVVPGKFYGLRLLLYPVGVFGALLGVIAMLLGGGLWAVSLFAPHLSSSGPQLLAGGFAAVLVGGSLFFVCGGAYEE